jgi:hypothetical protein
MKAKEFDSAFDEGTDISEFLDLSKAKRPEQVQKKSKRRFSIVDDPIIGQRGQTSWGPKAINYKGLGGRTS